MESPVHSQDSLKHSLQRSTSVTRKGLHVIDRHKHAMTHIFEPLLVVAGIQCNSCDELGGNRQAGSCGQAIISPKTRTLTVRGSRATQKDTSTEERLNRGDGGCWGGTF